MNDEQHTAAIARLRALCVAGGIAVSIAGYIREADLARLLGVDARTARRWRHDGTGPPATKIGGGYRYALGPLAEYLARTRTDADESGQEDIADSDEPAEDGANPLHRKAQ
jgi:hypothetical protein